VVEAAGANSRAAGPFDGTPRPRPRDVRRVRPDPLAQDLGTALAVVVDSAGFVHAAGRDGVVHAADLVTGEPRRQYRSGAPITADLVVDGPFLIAGADDGTLHTMDATAG
jgi:hypothetical protein